MLQSQAATASKRGRRGTFSKGVGAHKLIPVQREVLILVIIVQQLPQILLSPQHLQMTVCLTATVRTYSPSPDNCMRLSMQSSFYYSPGPGASQHLPSLLPFRLSTFETAKSLP